MVVLELQLKTVDIEMTIMEANNVMIKGYKNSTLRLWQSSGTELHPHNFMLPLFITDESPDARFDYSSKSLSFPIKSHYFLSPRKYTQYL